jgi:hypothetical protein
MKALSLFSGIGGFDLYRCESTGSDGDWKYPVNLGTVVNTNGNEMFPYVDAKGYLFFASDRLPGLGGLDLFRVKLMNGLPAGKPENLGAPMNSTSDDFGITFSTDGKLLNITDAKEFENCDPEQLGLIEVHSQIWNTFIFINLTSGQEIFRLRLYKIITNTKKNNRKYLTIYQYNM